MDDSLIVAVVLKLDSFVTLGATCLDKIAVVQGAEAKLALNFEGLW
jgi:hypothetical protein